MRRVVHGVGLALNGVGLATLVVLALLGGSGTVIVINQADPTGWLAGPAHLVTQAGPTGVALGLGGVVALVLGLKTWYGLDQPWWLRLAGWFTQPTAAAVYPLVGYLFRPDPYLEVVVGVRGLYLVHVGALYHKRDLYTEMYHEAILARAARIKPGDLTGLLQVTPPEPTTLVGVLPSEIRLQAVAQAEACLTRYFAQPDPSLWTQAYTFVVNHPVGVGLGLFAGGALLYLLIAHFAASSLLRLEADELSAAAEERVRLAGLQAEQKFFVSANEVGSKFKTATTQDLTALRRARLDLRQVADFQVDRLNLTATRGRTTLQNYIEALGAGPRGNTPAFDHLRNTTLHALDESARLRLVVDPVGHLGNPQFAALVGRGGRGLAGLASEAHDTAQAAGTNAGAALKGVFHLTNHLTGRDPEGLKKVAILLKNLSETG